MNPFRHFCRTHSGRGMAHHKAFSYTG